MLNIAEFQPETYTAEPSLWQILKMPDNGIELHQAIITGLPAQLLEDFAAISGFDKTQLLQVASIPARTYARRLSNNNALTPQESNSLARIIKIYQAALELFAGDFQAASQWCVTPVVGLGGQTPLALSASEAGEDSVLDLVGQLEHGVFA